VTSDLEQKALNKEGNKQRWNTFHFMIHLKPLQITAFAN